MRASKCLKLRTRNFIYIYIYTQNCNGRLREYRNAFCYFVWSVHTQKIPQTHFANSTNRNKIKYFLGRRVTQTSHKTDTNTSLFPGEQTPPWSRLLLRIIPGRMRPKYQTNRGNITKTAGRIHPGICTRCCQVWNIERKLRQLSWNSERKQDILHNFSIKKYTNPQTA